jgi:hypothetical protein
MSNALMKLAGGELSTELMDKLRSQAEQERQRIGSSAGGDVITISNGKRKFIMPNEQELDEFEAHIVDFAYRNEYYIGPYNPKEITPPACFAIASSTAQLTPSENSPIIQSQTDCSTCQQNQFGSHPNGAGKACKNTVILAVLPPDGVADHEMWVLKTSPTAIRPFNKYASMVSQMDISLSVVRTRFFFDPESEYASVRFEAVGVGPENFDALLERKAEAERRLQQEPDVSQFEMPTSSR